MYQSFAAQRHQEFIGTGQHDAQEFLTVLLDAIHEVEIFIVCIKNLNPQTF